jgi:predicted ATP-grasp superfamily ATP-dependent carboligase
MTEYIHVVLLDAEASLGIQVVHSLFQAGNYKVTVLHSCKKSPLKFSRFCHFVHLEHWDADKGIEQLSFLVGSIEKSILIPASTIAMRWIIIHADELRKTWLLPFLPEKKTFEIAVNKSSFYLFLQEKRLKTPPTHLESEGGDPLQKLAFPILLKPSVGSGGVGIRKIEDKVQLQNIDRSQKFILQNYIEGYDISYGVLCKQGEVYAASAYTCLTRHAEFGPFKSMQLVDHPESMNVIKALMKELSWHGIANVDLRITPDNEVYILELNPRLFGNMRNILGSGINFADQFCLSAMGKETRCPTVTGSCYFSIPGALALFFSKLKRRKSPLSFEWKHSTFAYLLKDPFFYLIWIFQRIRMNGFATFKKLFYLVFMTRLRQEKRARRMI